MDTFWVMENKAHGYARIHRGRCPSCMDGSGPRPGHGGMWRGPFTTFEDALIRANVPGKHSDELNCPRCNPEREGE